MISAKVVRWTSTVSLIGVSERVMECSGSDGYLPAKEFSVLQFGCTVFPSELLASSIEHYLGGNTTLQLSQRLVGEVKVWGVKVALELTSDFAISSATPVIDCIVCNRQTMRADMRAGVHAGARRACAMRLWKALVETVQRSTALSVPMHWMPLQTPRWP